MGVCLLRWLRASTCALFIADWLWLCMVCWLVCFGWFGVLFVLLFCVWFAVGGLFCWWILWVMWVLQGSLLLSVLVWLIMCGRGFNGLCCISCLACLRFAFKFAFRGMVVF